jgi:hypothetical protein
MYHGGTNPVGKTSMNESKATGYPNDYPVLNYDFGTCLSQYGEARGQYKYLNLLHLFIDDFKEILAPMVHVAASEFVDENNLTNLRYCMRSNGKSGFIFVNNHQRKANLFAKEGVEFDVLGKKLPAINVESDAAFILPVNITLGEETLEYATAQLICREGNTFFFTEIPGVTPRFKFAGEEEFEGFSGFYSKQVGGITVVVLKFEDALYLRKLNGKIYVGSGCDLYMDKDKLSCIEPGDFEYREWSGKDFYVNHKEIDYKPARWELIDTDASVKVPEMFEWELNIEAETPRKLSVKKILTQSKEGFIELNEKYDTAIVMADGIPVADKFYDGAPWRIPASLLTDKESYLVMSELRDDISLS